MRLIKTPIPGCCQIRYSPHQDARGVFLKTFARSQFDRDGLETTFVESFCTLSGANVLRGMHLQLPPKDHAKLVYCLAGSVTDVALDLRRGSPSFGSYITCELSFERPIALYLPRGVAHGFLVKCAPALMMYHVTTEHVPDLDAGVAWNSFGFQWPHHAPLLSTRDAALPRFDDFLSPFRYTDAVEHLQGSKWP
jgi:dTDP-4-dehydrorhamnose 3,5-epimerase